MNSLSITPENIFLKQFSVIAGNVRELVDYLNESLELLSRNSNILDNVLETLDIQQHSLGYMFILLAKFAETPAAIQVLADTDTVVKLFRNFTNLCNGEQVRSAPNQCECQFGLFWVIHTKIFFVFLQSLSYIIVSPVT